MSYPMEEDGPTSRSGESGEAQPSSSTGADPRVVAIIQTGATQFSQGVMQSTGTTQSMDQIIASYSSSSSSTGTYSFGSSSGSYSTTLSEETTSEKMDVEGEKEKKKQDAEPTFTCAACYGVFEITGIIFSCFGCVDGTLCSTCTTQHIGAWKRNGVRDESRTIDTDRQVVFISATHVLGCPVCRRAFSPAPYDSTLAWYIPPTFPPEGNQYAAISADYSTADPEIDRIENGFGRARYFKDYIAYLTGKTQLPGDCPHCGDGAGRYVSIPARDAATRGRQPWGNNAPWCLTCPSAQPFGADDNLLFCCRCRQSVLHTRHATQTGVETGTFYTQTF